MLSFMRLFLGVTILGITACGGEPTSATTSSQIEKAEPITSTYSVKDFVGTYIGSDGQLAQVWSKNGEAILEWVTGEDIYLRNSYTMRLDDKTLVNTSKEKGVKIRLEIKDVTKKTYQIFVDDNPEFEPSKVALQKVEMETSFKGFGNTDITISKFTKQEYQYLANVSFLNITIDASSGEQIVANEEEIPNMEWIFKTYQDKTGKVIATETLQQQWTEKRYYTVAIYNNKIIKLYSQQKF